MNSISKAYRVYLQLLITLALTYGLLPLFGCKSRPPRAYPIALNVAIQTTPQAASLTIPVYVGAGNQTYDKGLLEEPVDPLLERLRSSQPIDIKRFQLTLSGTNITKLDPQWSLWLRQKRADHLVVIADLPKNFGGESRRRLVLPLDGKLWRRLPKDRTVRVEVQETGVTLLTPPGL